MNRLIFSALLVMAILVPGVSFAADKSQAIEMKKTLAASQLLATDVQQARVSSRRLLGLKDIKQGNDVSFTLNFKEVSRADIKGISQVTYDVLLPSDPEQVLQPDLVGFLSGSTLSLALPAVGSVFSYVFKLNRRAEGPGIETFAFDLACDFSEGPPFGCGISISPSAQTSSVELVNR